MYIRPAVLSMLPAFPKSNRTRKTSEIRYGRLESTGSANVAVWPSPKAVTEE